MTKGQTLIEVLVAITAAVLVISAIAVAIISALNNAQFSKNQNMATQYAQEGMEIIRQIRSSDWSTFNNLSTGHYCLDKDSKELVLSIDCGQNVDIFVREIDIEKNSSSCNNNQTKAIIQVSWSDGKCTNRINLFCHKVRLVSCFSDFNVVPTP